MADDESIDGFLELMGVDYFEAVQAITEWQERQARPRGKAGRPPRWRRDGPVLLEEVDRLKIRHGLTDEIACRRLAMQDDRWKPPRKSDLPQWTKTLMNVVSRQRSLSRKSPSPFPGSQIL